MTSKQISDKEKKEEMEGERGKVRREKEKGREEKEGRKGKEGREGVDFFVSSIRKAVSILKVTQCSKELI